MGNELGSQSPVDVATTVERQSLSPVIDPNKIVSFEAAVSSKNRPITKRTSTSSGGNSYRAYIWEERVCPVDATKSYYVCQGENDKMNQFTDCWDIEDPNDDLFIQMHRSLPHTICLKPRRDKRSKSWVSCVGTKIANKNQYIRWKIKILPNSEDRSNSIIASKAANVMIGVVDTQTIPREQSGKAINAPFWKGDYFGYAVGRAKSKKGVTATKKYKIGDVVTIELNRKSNGHITHNELRYYTNDMVESTMFNVDMGRNYVLAVAMCDNNCQIQISD